MGLRILIVPDKFKGTLTAGQAAEAIANGWKRARPDDVLQLLPMTDGGDGFGQIVGELLGAKARAVSTMDAAHRPLVAHWWWDKRSRTAVVESARVIGLALLPHRKFHPFQLDTYGLGKVLQSVARLKPEKCLVGIGGSATNDGGFGLARGLGWRFYGGSGEELAEWWQLGTLARVCCPSNPPRLGLTVAVDVRNPLLGPAGCTRVYGPQKGLRPEDFAHAENCLRRLSLVLREQHGIDASKVAGAGAAGGLGFGLIAFAGAKVESGFDIFARCAELERHVSGADVVVTGEGALDAQTQMGKGVGQVARCAKRCRVPCVGLAGLVDPSLKRVGLFAELRGLTEIAPLDRARKQAARCLRELARKTARAWRS